MRGHFALILHAHLPFVRHPEHEHFLEEDWLFEAITETYIPLLHMMQRLVDDLVPFKLTMSITPTLCAMLQDQLLCERYVRHLDLLIDLAARERTRNRKHLQLCELAEFYVGLFSEVRRLYVDEWKCDLLSVIRELRQTGALEIIASAASHGLLPILQQQSPRAARAQVLIGRDVYVELFAGEPVGFWLPECGYAPGLESILQEANLRWFVVDAHGLLFGMPRPCRSIYAPCYTPAGPAAFARDLAASRQVWSAHEGYPGDPAYREFYRDIGFDLPIEHLGSIARGTRKFSGVKYHRITGRGDEKQLYDRTAAENTAAQHAIHFLEECREQISEIGDVGFDPIVVAPFDAELFGHWWFEGPLFLEQFIRHAGDEGDFRLTPPSEYLAAHSTQQIVGPAASTWGENGHLAVWLDPSNAWIYPQLNAAALRMCEVAERYAASGSNMTDTCDRILKQLARELLLAQSSDWAFLMKTGTAREYATQRTIDHLARFNRLHDQFVTNDPDEEFLRDCEWRDNIFPNVNCATMLKSRIADRRFNLLTLLSCVAFAAIAAAQESPTSTSSPTPGESPSPSISPEQSVPPSPTPEQTPSPSPARSVRISFIPPPMDGTISLGIYDQAGKIVRVLHQNAQLDDFAIGADALVTRWDGKDDGHQDSPSGRYHARGYMVGPLKREDLGKTSPPSIQIEANVVKVRLVRNPLRKDKRPVVELGIGSNGEGSYLKTSDGLPLFKVSEISNVTRAGIAAKSENAVDIWQDDGASVHQFRISNVDQMMAFDCGEFELK